MYNVKIVIQIAMFRLFLNYNCVSEKNGKILLIKIAVFAIYTISICAFNLEKNKKKNNFFFCLEEITLLYCTFFFSVFFFSIFYRIPFYVFSFFCLVLIRTDLFVQKTKRTVRRQQNKKKKKEIEIKRKRKIC